MLLNISNFAYFREGQQHSQTIAINCPTYLAKAHINILF